MHLLINDSIISGFIALVKKNGIIFWPTKGRGEDFLGQLIKVTKVDNFSWKKIKGIIIISDSGSFTQIRIIATVVNVVAEFFTIPRSFINTHKNQGVQRAFKQGIKKLENKPIFLCYNKRPNITRAA